MSHILIFPNFDISHMILFGNGRDFSSIIWSNLVGPKLQIIGFGSHGHKQKTKTMKNEGVRIFPKWIQKVTSPKWSRIIVRSFRATLFWKITVRMAPQTHPPDPKLWFFPYRIRWAEDRWLPGCLEAHDRFRDCLCAALGIRARRYFSPA